MKYDFDRVIDRRGCGACKWLEAPAGAWPMTIADMEFASPPEVVAALRERAEIGNFGYTVMVEEDYRAVIDFVRARHGIEIPREQLLSTPGVLYTMRCAMYMLTRPGDKVVVIAPFTPHRSIPPECRAGFHVSAGCAVRRTAITPSTSTIWKNSFRMAQSS